jgi:hypothetical protein
LLLFSHRIYLSLMLSVVFFSLSCLLSNRRLSFDWSLSLSLSFFFVTDTCLKITNRKRKRKHPSRQPAGNATLNTLQSKHVSLDNQFEWYTRRHRSWLLFISLINIYRWRLLSFVNNRWNRRNASALVNVMLITIVKIRTRAIWESEHFFSWQLLKHIHCQ